MATKYRGYVQAISCTKLTTEMLETIRDTEQIRYLILESSMVSISKMCNLVIKNQEGVGNFDNKVRFLMNNYTEGGKYANNCVNIGNTKKMLWYKDVNV